MCKAICYAPSCRCESPCDAYYRAESCDGLGRAAGCEGCDACIEEVTRTTTHVARRARPALGIQPGDRYIRTVGFRYQRGGPRSYLKPVIRLVKRAPRHDA